MATGDDDRPRRAVLVGAFRSVVSEGDDGPCGSCGGFVDTLGPAPYSLAAGTLAAFALADPAVRRRWRVELLHLAEPLEIEDDREELRFSPAHLDAILALEPDVVAFSAYCWNVDAIREAAPALKARRPGLAILLGGRAVEGEPEALLAGLDGVDALVVGEGERAFREILRRGGGAAPADLEGIAGVVARRAGGVVSGGPPRPVDDLDEIPSPYLTGLIEPPRHGAMVELSRGCLHACGYCTWSADKRLRFFGPARVEAEIGWLLARGHRHTTLTDAAINYDTARLAAAVDAIHRADPAGELRFTYNVRHDAIDEAQLEALRRLPTHTVLLGVESLCAEAFAHVERAPTDLATLEARLAALARATRPPVVSLVLGLPGDTEEGFARTLDTLLDRARAGVVGAVLVSLLQGYRGSALWARREALGLRFRERGIPYLLEGPSWPAPALARSKALLVRRMAAEPGLLKAAEAIVLMESEGGLDPWLSPRRARALLARWPAGEAREGWALARLGLLRDTGRALSLRFAWRDGGEARVLLERRPAGGRRGPGDTRLYALSARPLPGCPAHREALARLLALARDVILEAEERLARARS